MNLLKKGELKDVFKIMKGLITVNHFYDGGSGFIRNIPKVVEKSLRPWRKQRR